MKLFWASELSKRMSHLSSAAFLLISNWEQPHQKGYTVTANWTFVPGRRWKCRSIFTGKSITNFICLTSWLDLRNEVGEWRGRLAAVIRFRRDCWCCRNPTTYLPCHICSRTKLLPGTEDERIAMTLSDSFCQIVLLSGRWVARKLSRQQTSLNFTLGQSDFWSPPTPSEDVWWWSVDSDAVPIKRIIWSETRMLPW